MNRTIRAFRLTVAIALVGLVPQAMQATNGKSALHPDDEKVEGLRVSPNPSYYEEIAEGRIWKATAESGMPNRLHLEDTEAFLRYRTLREGPMAAQWEVRVENFSRHHETVEGIYDMVGHLEKFSPLVYRKVDGIRSHGSDAAARDAQR